MIRPGRCALLLSVVIPLVAAALVQAAAPPDYEGKTISEISFAPREQPLSRDALGLALRIRAGDRFDSREVSAAIERLYATGRYRDIEVDAELDQKGGVVLTILTEPNFFVSRTTVDGVPDPPNKGELVSATQLELGESYEENDIPEAVTALQRLLRENGFYAPDIQWTSQTRLATEEVDIRFQVRAGSRARFSRPVVTGQPGIPVRKVIGLANWDRWWGLLGWKTVTEERTRNGIGRIRNYYLKKDYLEAKVQIERLEYQEKSNTVQPHLLVEAGPRVSITTLGAKVSKGNLRNLIPVYQERTVDRDLLLEGQRNLTDYFQARGYFDANVEFVTKESKETGEEVIEYRITRGPRFKLDAIMVEGNQYFRDEDIRERLSMTEAHWLRYRRGRFSRALLARDIEAIEDLYRSNGFRDVRVTSNVDQSYRGKQRNLGVTLQIEEGPQWMVEALEIRGVDLRLIPEVEGMITSTAGQPYSNSNIVIDRDAILGYYFNSGYPEAQFDFTVVPDSAAHRVRLEYRIVEGRRNFVRDVLVSGYGETDPELVQNRMLLQPQDPLSQSRMVETQRRLYDLGIFAKVDVAIQNPEGRERDKYVLFQLEPASRYSITLGFGAEIGRIGGGSDFQAPAGTAGFSPRGSFGVSRLNFLGTGHTVGLQTRLSNFQRRALINYFAPQFRGRDNVNLTISTLYDFSRDIRTFTSRRVEAAAQVGQRFTRANSAQYRLTFRRVSLDEGSLNIGDQSLIPIFSQPVRVGLVSGTFIQDRRDDPIESTRGYYNSIDAGLATRLLASQTQYFRTVVRNSSYHALNRDSVFARTSTFGWLYNYGSREIPLPERFYGGGASSHRAFPDNQAGPRDPITGFPVGGTAFLFNSIELRFPLLGTNLGGVLFHDMGNVYSEIDKLSFRVRQRGLQDFDYMVHAVGFGIRYRTPIGPVRVDLAYAPNTPQFFGFEGTRQDLLLGGGIANRVFRRVNRFQFHFSLGQTF